MTEKRIDSHTRIAARCVTIALLLATVAAHGQMPPDPRELWDQATVYRDEWGVPHVTADNVLALAFAFGYAQADDHLEGMLMAYRVANGRAAEVYGEPLAESDAFALKMAHARLAAEALIQAEPITRDLCEGFALGVNAWMIEHPRALPDWAEGVSPADILALWHCYVTSFAPFDLPDMYHRPPAAASGNAWAIAPQRSASGAAILAINPHTTYNGPFAWYEAHLTVGTYDMMGATLFGLPVIVQGHNGFLGWALTPNQPDLADIYTAPSDEIPANQGDLDKLAKAAALPLQIATSGQPYYVRTASGNMEQRSVPVFVSPIGPIVGQYRGAYCAYRVGGYREFGFLNQFIEMGSARSLDQFQAAISMRQIPCFHITYADQAGNLFYVYNVTTGVRPSPEGAGDISGDEPMVVSIDWTRPLPSERLEYAWGKTVPLDTLPYMINPPAGFIQACGNPPWGATASPGFGPESWPEWFARDKDTFRAQRVRWLLGLGTRTFDEAQAMLFDVLAPFAMEAVPRLVEAADAQPAWMAQAHPDLPQAIEILRGWNYVAEPTSEGMTLFHAWWGAFGAISPSGWSTSDFDAAVRRNPQAMQVTLLQAADEAARFMRNEFQSVAVPWGEAHVLRRGDRVVGMPGSLSGEPVLAASAERFQDGVWETEYGYGYAMAVEFGERVSAVSVSPFGTSEDPESPHFDDQLDLMIDRRMKPAFFLQEDLLRHAVSGYGRIVRLGAKGMEGRFTVRSAAPVQAHVTTTTEAPSPLPTGLVPFSVYASLHCDRTDARTAMEVEIVVPEVLCPAESLHQLAIHAYDAAQGWQLLQSQRLDGTRRMFVARDGAPRTYAVLGPEALRPWVPEAEPEVPAEGDTLSASHSEDGPLPLNAPVVPGAPAGTRAEPAPPSPAATGPTIPRPASSQPESPPSAAAPSRGQVEAVAWGHTLQLRPKGVDAEVRLRASETVGARLVASSDAPGMVPEGLAAFSEFLALECSEPAKLTAIEIAFHASEAVCAAAHLGGLGVYAYDTQEGWVRLEQTADVATRHFSATDSAPRIYALLGPEQHRIFAPGL
ncbi:MAG: penicillin acylase family protein [bacterium]|nr:penicillin acylase family protein [bacterium]